MDGIFPFCKLRSNIKKIKSFSHGEFNNSLLNENSIEEKILKNEDIFNRGFTLKKIDLKKLSKIYL